MRISRAEYQREWRKKNKEKCYSYSKKYWSNNREKRRELQRDWVARNREWSSFQRYQYRIEIKKEVIAHYSNNSMSCAHCGNNDLDVLCIDHIENNGAQDRKENNISCRGINNGVQIHDVLKRKNFPTGYQVLCANCNLKKEIVRKRNLKIASNKYFEEYTRKGFVEKCQ